LFGAIFIGLAIILVPQLGAAIFIVLLVTGQLLASVALDRFAPFGLVPRPVDVPRVIAVILLIGGVVLIRRLRVSETSRTVGFPAVGLVLTARQSIPDVKHKS